MITFSILGDMGSGLDEQFKVSLALGKNIKSNKGQFICGLGDNIYPSGCSSKDDTQFIEKFEIPYKNIPDKIKFYMCLGNHDYGNYWDKTFRDCSESQIQYGIQSQVDCLKKWYLPDHYYTYSKRQGNTSIDFFVIDTNIDLMTQKLKNQQMNFMVNAIKKSKADWKILYGHHTFISIAGHGNAEPELNTYIRKLLRLGIDMYMNGHDHNKQIVETKIGKKNIVIVTCGSGGNYCDDELNFDNIDHKSKLVWHSETLGFGTVFCNKNKLRLEMFDETNKLEKSYVIDKKSKKTKRKAIKKTKRRNSKNKNMSGGFNFSKLKLGKLASVGAEAVEDKGVSPTEEIFNPLHPTYMTGMELTEAPVEAPDPGSVRALAEAEAPAVVPVEAVAPVEAPAQAEAPAEAPVEASVEEPSVISISIKWSTKTKKSKRRKVKRVASEDELGPEPEPEDILSPALEPTPELATPHPDALLLSDR